jgi:hypothetical protein
LLPGGGVLMFFGDLAGFFEECALSDKEVKQGRKNANCNAVNSTLRMFFICTLRE